MASTTINDMPLEIMTEVFTHLDYNSAQNLRRVCSTLDSLYLKYRCSMNGPVCNAEVRSYRGDLRLKLQHETYKNASIFVTLEEWSFYFRNVNVKRLTITTDECISSDLIPKLLCCRSVEKVNYLGGEINDDWLKSLGGLATERFDIRVREWKENLEVTSKREQVLIAGNVENLQNISNLMKNVEILTWSMTWESFSNCLNYLEKIPKRNFEIKTWTINFKEVPHEEDINPMCDRFFEKMKQCTKVNIEHAVGRNSDSLDHEMRIYRV